MLAAGDHSNDFRARESIRQLSTNLTFIDVDNEPRRFVVTSARMGEGKSTLAAALGMALAEAVNGITELHRRLARGYRNPMPPSSHGAPTAPHQ